MSETAGWTGGCLCGAVRYQAATAPIWASYCHCGMCRKASGAPFASWVEFPAGSVAWTGAEAARYNSSEGAIRRFCATCGTLLTFEAEGLMFMTLGSLDHPEKVTVERHCYTSARLPGIRMADGLPELPGPFGGKGGKAVD